MYLYFPTDVFNIVVKYIPKEMVIYLKIKDMELRKISHHLFDWKKLYYILYGEREVKPQYRSNNLKKTNIFLDGIMNRINEKHEIIKGILHKLKLTTDGKVFAIGDNKSGQLGLGDKINRSEWVEVKIPVKATQIECGKKHSMILLENGKGLMAGNNYYGQLGFGAHYNIIPTRNQKISYREQLYGLEDNKTTNYWREINIPEKIIQIKCGDFHSMLLLENNNALVTGNGRFGALGLEAKFKGIKFKWEYIKFRDVVRIDCGKKHSEVLLETGTLLKTNKKGKWIKIT